MDLTHLTDEALLRDFTALVAQDRRNTAALLSHIAEIDARHLYLQAGFESMRAYCVHALHLSEDAAAKRLQVARLARELPALFPAIADGRLHLGAILRLSARLTRSNVDEWVVAAANRSISEIDVLIAQRYPQAESLRLDDGVSPQVVVRQGSDPISHATWRASAKSFAPQTDAPPREVSIEPGAALVAVAPRARTMIAPLSPERYTLQVTIAGATHDKLRRAQELLGHSVPSGDVARVLDRALDALLVRLERRKFALTERPRESRPLAITRCIPARVRRAVYLRDGGKCVFVDAEGRRCGSKSRLEFDHVIPLARGGRTAVANLRLLCRAHNLHAAERAFGTNFMQRFRN